MSPWSGLPYVDRFHHGCMKPWRISEGVWDAHFPSGELITNIFVDRMRYCMAENFT